MLGYIVADFLQKRMVVWKQSVTDRIPVYLIGENWLLNLPKI